MVVPTFARAAHGTGGEQPLGPLEGGSVDKRFVASLVGPIGEIGTGLNRRLRRPLPEEHEVRDPNSTKEVSEVAMRLGALRNDGMLIIYEPAGSGQSATNFFDHRHRHRRWHPAK